MGDRMEQEGRGTSEPDSRLGAEGRIKKINYVSEVSVNKTLFTLLRSAAIHIYHPALAISAARISLRSGGSLIFHFNHFLYAGV
ncbi:hypothetical protein [Azohydromonas aeria]|uniref:hypothetical protein n=1 Tax=Azohydromonas aeria TaxID=2590212 RepID=UPI0012FC32FF|nr:hypothetical protein [Azohydromonas aeria]